MTLSEYIEKYRRGTPALTNTEARIAGLALPLTRGWFANNRNKEVDGVAMSATLKTFRKKKAGDKKVRAASGKSPKALFSKHEPAQIRVCAPAGRGDDIYAYINSPEFLQSFEWRQLRFQALQKHGRRCQCCGASPETGAVLNVDHVKSRRRFPALALDIDNLQVLCADCNHGKANSTVDFRAQ